MFSLPTRSSHLENIIQQYRRWRLDNWITRQKTEGPRLSFVPRRFEVWLITGRHWAGETLAESFGAVGGEPEAPPVTEHVSPLLSCQAAHGLAVGETLTLVLGTVGRVGETAPLAPGVHPLHAGVRLCGHTDVGRHHQRLLLLLLAVHTEGPGWVGSHYGVYLDVSTVPEHLLVPAAHALSPVAALAPGVAGEVRPLHHTLAAGQPGRQHHLHSQGTRGETLAHKHRPPGTGTWWSSGSPAARRTCHCRCPPPLAGWSQNTPGLDLTRRRPRGRSWARSIPSGWRRCQCRHL